MMTIKEAYNKLNNNKGYALHEARGSQMAAKRRLAKKLGIKEFAADDMEVGIDELNEKKLPKSAKRHVAYRNGSRHHDR